MQVQKCKKKLKIICWKKSWKNVENCLFSIFFWRFSTFFQISFQHIFFNFLLHFYDRQELSKILSFWWKVTFLNGFASREESVTSKKHRFFRIFCMLRFFLWWPNRYGKWLFTKKIKFCLVPGDPKNAKKNMLKFFLKKCWKSSKKCWK